MNRKIPERQLTQRAFGGFAAWTDEVSLGFTSTRQSMYFCGRQQHHRQQGFPSSSSTKFTEAQLVSIRVSNLLYSKEYWMHPDEGIGRFPQWARCRQSTSRKLVLPLPFSEAQMSIGIRRRRIELDHSAHGIILVLGCAIQLLVRLSRDEIDNLLLGEFEFFQELINRHGVVIGIEFLC